MSLGHWYRLRKEPERFSRLTTERLGALAEYVGWTRAQVMVAIGWLDQQELVEFLRVGRALDDALLRLERSGLANGLSTPLSKAAADHRLLMARLWIVAEARTVEENARTS